MHRWKTSCRHRCTPGRGFVKLVLLLTSKGKFVSDQLIDVWMVGEVMSRHIGTSQKGLWSVSCCNLLKIKFVLSGNFESASYRSDSLASILKFAIDHFWSCEWFSQSFWINLVPSCQSKDFFRPISCSQWFSNFLLIDLFEELQDCSTSIFSFWRKMLKTLFVCASACRRRNGWNSTIRQPQKRAG